MSSEMGSERGFALEEHPGGGTLLAALVNSVSELLRQGRGK